MTPYNLAPAAHVALAGVLLASPVLLWLVLRHRHASLPTQLRALSWLIVFFTFDLIVFGAFTRLTDSGLGCPDWPGCYGHASPLGAHDPISSAQAALPSGPVTHAKAWIEMIHRYLAAGVGVLITVLAAASWWASRDRSRRAEVAPRWATLALAWVIVQGAFGALTVTMKLYPLIVTLHLLGGIGLLAVMAVMAQRLEAPPLRLPVRLRVLACSVAGLALLQVALGGWVSTNYAVLACTGFPSCSGQWWPDMDFTHGFTLLRELGAGRDGGYLPFEALVAIHWTHRMAAAVLLVAMAWLAWALWRQPLAPSQAPTARRFATSLAALGAWQLATGLSNVVFGWPIVAALAHTAGAAALIALLAVLLARTVHATEPAARATAAQPQLAS